MKTIHNLDFSSIRLLCSLSCACYSGCGAEIKPKRLNSLKRNSDALPKTNDLEDLFRQDFYT